MKRKQQQGFDNDLEPKKKKVKNLLDMEDAEILKLNPRPRNFAKYQSFDTTFNEIKKWKKNIPIDSNFYFGNFSDSKESTYHGQEAAIQEALRCLKCADAPCSRSCPVQIDVKQFIHCMATRNYYGAAKTILSDNPNGFSCGEVCPVSTYCVGGCNIAENPININGLQAFAMDMFKRMYYEGGLKQILPPYINAESKSYETKIAVIGCGPGGMACASYLGRLGYKDITIFEKESYGGGLSISEIPQNRLSAENVKFEIQLMRDLGVKIVYNKALGKDFTISTLKREGYRAIFCGMGLPTPRTIPAFEGLDESNRYYNSKTFLPVANRAVKFGNLQLTEENEKIPKLFGHVVILGAGDTAMDCASTAVRCGAQEVTIILRRQFSEIRAVEEERDAVIKEKVNFLTNFTVKSVTKDAEGKVKAVVCGRTVYGENGKLREDGQELTIPCQFIMSAFGSYFGDEEVRKASEPITWTSWGMVKVDERCNTNVPGIYAGGDLVGRKTTVEATNDGKTSAWQIHKYLQSKFGVAVTGIPQLPQFYTEIDLVDLSVHMSGMKFENPFGFASAPPSTSIAMIGRGFEAGWSFAVTKTIVMDIDAIQNVSPRIVRGTQAGHNYGPNQTAFLNIEMVSEKSMEYWLEGVRQLKKRYPTKIVIASIMAPFEKIKWVTMAKYFEAAGADALELNLSCPHGTGEKGMGLAVGQNAKTVSQITKWVKDVAKIPVFPKMTPNITDVRDIAVGAKEGGADGVLCTNTVSALMGLKPNGVAWPNVGGKSTYGGMSGNAIRPIVLKALSAVWNVIPGINMMGSGGCESGETALQMIHCGASVVQVSSAVHNQNFSIISDLTSGLKALMWINAQPEVFKHWEGQSPPMKKFRRRPGAGHKLGKMGKDLEKHRRIIMDDIETHGPLVDHTEYPQLTPQQVGRVKVPRINDIIGKACKNIVKFFDMDPSGKEHVIALVDEDLCVNCGRCYQTCADCGYQAIRLNEENHLPFVDPEECTGCTLCLSVCPIMDCITMVKRPTKYTPCRGIDLGRFGEESLMKDENEEVDF